MTRRQITIIAILLFSWSTAKIDQSTKVIASEYSQLKKCKNPHREFIINNQLLSVDKHQITAIAIVIILVIIIVISRLIYYKNLITTPL